MERGDCIKETKRILGQYNKMKVAVQNLAEEIEARCAALQGESVAIARYGKADGRHGGADGDGGGNGEAHEGGGRHCGDARAQAGNRADAAGG